MWCLGRHEETLSALVALCAAASQAHAIDARLKSGLLKLDPNTRLEQRCDAELLDRIARDSAEYRPDKVVAYATATPNIQGDEIKTRGGAFRSKGQWYHIDFKCETAPDHMTVLSLRYRIGDEIPEDAWSKYNLWP